MQRVGMDSLGMEDIDQFWDINDSLPKARVSGSGTLNKTAVTYTSDDDSDFNYDTSDSISDDNNAFNDGDNDGDDEDTADEMELIRESQQQQSIVEPPENVSFDFNNNTNDSSLPLEDSIVELPVKVSAVPTAVVAPVPAKPVTTKPAQRDSLDSIGGELDISRRSSIGKSSNTGKVSPIKKSSPAVDSPAMSAVDFDNGEEAGAFDDGEHVPDDSVFASNDISPVATQPSPAIVSARISKQRGSESASKRRVSFGDELPAKQKEASHKPTRPAAKSSSSRSPVTPRSTDTSTMSAMSTPDSRDYVRGRKIIDETFELSDESATASEDEEEGITDKSGYTDTSFEKIIRQRTDPSSLANLQPGNFVEDEEGMGMVRRSTRATKGVKFAFWKGERVIYEEGGQLAGILRAEPTPKKKKIIRKRKLNDIAMKGAKAFMGHSSDEEDAPLDWTEPPVSKTKPAGPIKLPEDVTYISRDDALDRGFMVWRHDDNSIVPAKVICCKDHMPAPTALPITSDRRGKKAKRALAASYFSTPSVSGILPSWIAGYVELPPGAIKDEEAVGECTQVFFIGDCQDQSVEVGIADPSDEVWVDTMAQRLLLSKGDSFYVPPGNIYRLENHSASTPCTIFWNIIQPVEVAPAVDNNANYNSSTATMKTSAADAGKHRPSVHAY